MNLTLGDLQHFATCPKLYWLSKDRVNPYMQWFDHFDRCMHLLWNGLALQARAGEAVTLQNLLKRWGALYYPKATKDSIVGRVTRGGRWHDPDRGLFFMGIIAIRSGHEAWYKRAKEAIAAGTEWTLPVGAHTLQGRHDLITQENGETILWDLRFHTTPQRRSVRIDWEITAMAAAFQHRHGHLPNQIRVWEVVLDDQAETSRGSADFTILRDTVNQIVGSIERNVNYPVFSYQCEQCPFYQNCFSDYRTLIKSRKD